MIRRRSRTAADSVINGGNASGRRRHVDPAPPPGSAARPSRKPRENEGRARYSRDSGQRDPPGVKLTHDVRRIDEGARKNAGIVACVEGIGGAANMERQRSFHYYTSRAGRSSFRTSQSGGTMVGQNRKAIRRRASIDSSGTLLTLCQPRSYSNDRQEARLPKPRGLPSRGPNKQPAGQDDKPSPSKTPSLATAKNGNPDPYPSSAPNPDTQSTTRHVHRAAPKDASAMRPIRYRLGQALLDPGHSLPFTSASQASFLLADVPLNTPLFVKRSSKEWTYAKLVGRANEDQGAETIVVVRLDGSGKAWKVLEKNKWQSCLRLVDDSCVASAANDAGGAALAAFPGKNSAHELGRRPSLFGENITSVKLHHADANAKACAVGHGNGLSEDGATFISSSTAEGAHTGRPTSYRRISVPELSQSLPAIPMSSRSTAISSETKKKLAMMHPPSPSSNVTAHNGKRLGALERTMSLDDISSCKDITKSVSFHLDPESILQQYVDSTIKATAGTQFPIRLIPSRSDSSRSKPAKSPNPSSSSGPAKLSVGADKPPSNPSRQPSSPTTIMVNLHARHFRGSRRDRMRPMRRGRNSSAPPSLQRLSSLSGLSQVPRAQHDNGDEASCDATCAHGAGSEGSVWSSSSSFADHSSYADSLLGHPMTSAPSHAMATTHDAAKMLSDASATSTAGTLHNSTSVPSALVSPVLQALGAGVSMRLRGVDP